MTIKLHHAPDKMWAAYKRGGAGKKLTAEFNPPFSSFKLRNTCLSWFSYKINSSLLTQVFDWKMQQKLLFFFPSAATFSSTAFL